MLLSLNYCILSGLPEGQEAIWSRRKPLSWEHARSRWLS